jgi:hypothetical protein
MSSLVVRCDLKMYRLISCKISVSNDRINGIQNLFIHLWWEGLIMLSLAGQLVHSQAHSMVMQVPEILFDTVALVSQAFLTFVSAVVEVYTSHQQSISLLYFSDPILSYSPK